MTSANGTECIMDLESLNLLNLQIEVRFLDGFWMEALLPQKMMLALKVSKSDSNAIISFC